mgnify:FL=1
MDIIEKIVSNVEKTTKAVVRKSTDVVEITKLKIAISNAENEADGIINEIGQLVYEAYKSGEGKPELVEEKCEKIDEIRKDIDTKRNQYAKLRNLKRCAECENENDADAVFCNKCGAKLPEVEADEVEDMPGGASESEVIDAEEAAAEEKADTGSEE